MTIIGSGLVFMMNATLYQLEYLLNYSKPGSQLLDRAIASIRGLVEIDRAESDLRKGG